VSDTNQAREGDADFSAAWDEAAKGEQGQPQGRPDDLEPDQDAGTAGADADAGGNLPADEAQPSDASRPAEDEENPDDIWAGLSEAQRERIRALEAAEARAAKAENTLRSNEGRYSRTERELNELRMRLAQEPKPQPGATEEKPVAGASEEDLARVGEEYPDIAKPLLSEITSLRSLVEELSKDRSKEAELKQARDELELTEYLGRQEQTVAEKHADWLEVVASKDFAEWAPKQPGFVQELIRKNGSAIVDAEAAVDVLDRFKAATGNQGDPHAARRERQLAGSTHIPAKAPALQPAGRGDGSFGSEWDRLAREEARKSRGK